MKTWHQYSQNQFWIKSRFKSRGLAVLTLFLILFVNLAHAVEESLPGHFQIMEKLISLNKQQLIKHKREIEKDPNAFKILESFDKISEIFLHSDFIQSILLRSEKNYLNLVFPLNTKNICRFYALLENDLIQPIDHQELREYLVRYQLKTEDKDFNKKHIAYISKSDFFNILYTNKCQENRDFNKLFTAKFLEQSFSSLSFSVPTNNGECKNLMNEWRLNPYIPQLCGIAEKANLADTVLQSDSIKPSYSREKENLTREIKYINTKTTAFQRNYLFKVCRSLVDETLFCESYLSNNTWQKVAREELPDYLIQYNCQSLKNNFTSKLSSGDIKYCATQLEKNPLLCMALGSADYPASFPKPLCPLLASTINEGRLKTDYQDCPGKIEHLGLTNIHRIINHFDKRKFESRPQSCLGEMSLNFLTLLRDYEYIKAWPMKICYADKIEQKEICYPYITGSIKNKIYSEVEIIATAISRLQEVRNNLSCNLTNEKDYRPHLLKYRNGCYIVTSNQCTLQDCPRKIYYNQKEIKGIKYKGNLDFEYFPTLHKNSKYSAMKIIEHILKIKHYQLRNLTDIKGFLNKKPENILHGIGCAEDLMPSQFNRHSINDCIPTPFIIDGYYKENNNHFLVFRSSLGDVHSPTPLNWHALYLSLKNYQALHPSQTWTLYGMEKRF